MTQNNNSYDPLNSTLDSLPNTSNQSSFLNLCSTQQSSQDASSTVQQNPNCHYNQLQTQKISTQSAQQLQNKMYQENGSSSNKQLQLQVFLLNNKNTSASLKGLNTQIIKDSDSSASFKHHQQSYSQQNKQSGLACNSNLNRINHRNNFSQSSSQHTSNVINISTNAAASSIINTEGFNINSGLVLSKSMLNNSQEQENYQSKEQLEMFIQKQEQNQSSSNQLQTNSHLPQQNKIQSIPKSTNLFSKKLNKEKQQIHNGRQVIMIDLVQYNQMQETIQMLQSQIKASQPSSKPHNPQVQRKPNEFADQNAINEKTVPYEALRELYLKQKQKTNILKKQLRGLYSICYPEKNLDEKQKAEKK